MTNKFIIAFLNPNEGLFSQTVVDSNESAYNVLLSFLSNKEWEIDQSEFQNVEQLYSFAINCDCFVNIIQI